MAIKEEPLRSFISAIAAEIPALYDMIIVFFGFVVFEKLGAITMHK